MTRFLEYADYRTWYLAVRDSFISAARRVRAGSGRRCDICIAGGTTPLDVYRDLATDGVCASAFAGIETFLWPCDERWISPATPGRNDRGIETAWEPCMWEPRPRIVRWPAPGTEGNGTVSALEACGIHARTLSDAMCEGRKFGLVLLGIGDDGHTASLFPGSRELGETVLSCVPTQSPIPPCERVSFTLPVLGSAPDVIFVVRGARKYGVARSVAKGDGNLPASRVSRDARILYCASG